MLRHTIHFSGRVQGVGFRYTARQIAQRFAVAGYVMNLPDRRVLLVIEGEPDELDRYVEAIRGQMVDHIRDVTIAASPATGEFGDPLPGAGALTVRH